jgi:hypothetical protein
MFERLDPVGSGQILHPASQTMFPNSEITPTRGFEIKVVSARNQGAAPKPRRADQTLGSFHYPFFALAGLFCA